MTIATLSRRSILLGAGAAILAGPAALAQTFNFRFYGQTNQLLRGGPIAIPAYQIAFYTQQQGTAAASILARSRLTTTMAGVSEAMMRGLVDEAYADLRAKFEAAGLPLLPEDVTRADVDATGVVRAANNADVTQIGRTVTIGESVRKAYAAYGATKAPMIDGLHAPGATGIAVLGTMGTLNKMADAAKKNQAVFVMPGLIIEFAKTGASTSRGGLLGGAAANVNSQLQFTVPLGTNVALLTSMNNGRAATPGGMNLRAEVTSNTPFGTIATGEGAVRALSTGTVVVSNYIEQETSRGDAAVIDVPVWQGLVRTAFGDFNSALVAEFKKARG